MKTKLPGSIHILLAEDDRDERFFFDRALQELPMRTQLTTVVDGERLMEYFFKNTERHPDVLFLDLNMPRKNGMECLEEIKQHEKLKQIPVIIYSTSLRREVADTLYKTGAHYYLRKCNFSELPKSIESVIALLAENPNQPSRDKFVISEVGW